jgi:peptidoglycan biosynthesis protein MviN/MurJ (putative lipid II flippase)
MILPSIEALLSERPEWQQHIEHLQSATRLTALVWIALQMGLLFARLVLESVLNERGQAATEWACCGVCGKRLRSHGYRVRQITTLVGEIH